MFKDEDAQTNAQRFFEQGLGLFQSGKHQEAERFFSKALQSNPNHVEALHLLGIGEYQKQNFEQAIEYLKRAIRINAKSEYIHNTLSLAYQGNLQNEYALDHIDQALFLNSSIPEFHNSRGNALQGLRKPELAIKAYNNAIQINPRYAEAINNLGIVFAEEERHSDAITLYEQAIDINPYFYQAFNNLANSLKELGFIKRAFECYEKAIQINPQYFEAYINYGNALKKTKEYEAALQCYEQAIKIKPYLAEAHYLKGNIFQEIGRWEDTAQSYQNALTINPNYPEAKFALTVSFLPKVYSSNDLPEALRGKFASSLQDLYRWVNTKNNSNEFIKIGEHQPFYLAYQEKNNRDLLKQFGDIGYKLMSKWQESQGLRLKPKPASGKIKIGIVSAHFSNHPVWYSLTKGWLTGLDLSQFEIHLFSLGMIKDDQTAIAKSRSAVFHQGKKTLSVWANLILDSHIEALIFPEIGMHAQTRELASLQLAPVQIASWGHPETTGIPTITHFISAQAFESKDSPDHYTEKLITLSGIGCNYSETKTKASKLDLASIGLNLKSPILLCPGSPSKYMPEHDLVLVDIVRNIGNCQIVFFDFQKELTEILRIRISAAFNESGLDFNSYVKFIPFLQKEDFYRLMLQADVYLDTHGFSGFNTAMQAIECALPIVTKEGLFMRGRLASGILKHIGLNELVTQNTASYVEVVTRLVKDKNYQASIRQKIAESKQLAFNNLEPIKDLGQFLTKQLR